MRLVQDRHRGRFSLVFRLNKFFYYALLGYTITDTWFVYAGQNYMEDQVIVFLGGGFTAPVFGGGYRPVDPVVIKAQGIIVHR